MKGGSEVIKKILRKAANHLRKIRKQQKTVLLLCTNKGKDTNTYNDNLNIYLINILFINKVIQNVYIQRKGAT